MEEGLCQPHAELERDWLVVHRSAGDPELYHHYPVDFHQPPTKARCLKLSRSCLHIAQYFQHSKDDLWGWIISKDARGEAFIITWCYRPSPICLF